MICEFCCFRQSVMTTSGMIVVGSSILLFIWDCIAGSIGVDFTISRFVQQTGVNHPTLILAVGVIIGHVFCQMKPVVVTQEKGVEIDE